MPRRKRTLEEVLENVTDPYAIELFTAYHTLHGFVDEQDYNILYIEEKVKRDTLDNAAAILHDAAMEIQWPDAYAKRKAERSQ